MKIVGVCPGMTPYALGFFLLVALLVDVRATTWNDPIYRVQEEGEGYSSGGLSHKVSSTVLPTPSAVVTPTYMTQPPLPSEEPWFEVELSSEPSPDPSTSESSVSPAPEFSEAPTSDQESSSILPSPSEEPEASMLASPEPEKSSEPTIPTSSTPTPAPYCPAVSTCEEAFAKCRLGFDGYSDSLPSFYWGTIHDRSFTPRIVSRENGGPLLGHVASTGESCVIPKGDSKPYRISLFRPEGLRQSFSPSVFKSFEYEYYHAASGIGRETLQANQAQFLDGLCVITPLTAYQLLDETYYYNPYYEKVVGNEHPIDFGGDCVAYYIRSQAN